MSNLRHPALSGTLSLVALLALISSCSSTPTGPGGGGTVAKELDSGNIPNGGVFAHTFTSAGTKNYNCTIHAGMSGQVIVVSGSNDSVLITIANNNFSPTPAAVKVGGTVRWINNGTTHTVTSP